MPANPTLAAIIEEVRRQIASYQTVILKTGHAERLLAVAECAAELFAALDYTTPGWRETTCIIDEDSDEVNVAWCGLELALEHEAATPEQIERAFDAAASAGEKDNG